MPFKLSDPLRKLICAALLLAFTGRMALVFFYEINWDEFFFLNHIYAHERGALAPVFQTIYVHAFKWLSLTSHNEAEQVIAARIVMLLFQALTGLFIYLTARKFAGVNASAFAALCYFSFSYVIWQGASFRADGIAACLLMAALFLLIKENRTQLTYALAAFLTALSAMVTVKAVFFVPTLGFALLYGILVSERKKSAWLYAVFYGGLTAAFLIALYFLHAATFPDAQSGESFLGGGFNKSITLDPFFFGFGHFIFSLAANPFFWTFVIIGFCMAVRDKIRPRAMLLLALALPLVSLLIYRNAYPYYYVFILPPVSVLCALGWDWLAGKDRRALLMAALAALCINIVLHSFIRPIHRPLAPQREVLAVIHDLFPEPVPYLDRGGMVASFPWTGFFMSTWGMDNYRETVAIAHTPDSIPEPWGEARSIRTIIQEEQPVFILANIAQLDVYETVYDQEEIPSAYRLTPEDTLAIKENYLPFWGPVYLAGKKIETKGGAPQSFEIKVAGNYTLQSGSGISINGEAVARGDAIFLDAGTHDIRSANAEQTTRMLWGENLKPPDMEPSQKPLLSGF